MNTVIAVDFFGKPLEKGNVSDLLNFYISDSLNVCKDIAEFLVNNRTRISDDYFKNIFLNNHFKNTKLNRLIYNSNFVRENISKIPVGFGYYNLYSVVLNFSSYLNNLNSIANDSSEFDKNINLFLDNVVLFFRKFPSKSQSGRVHLDKLSNLLEKRISEVFKTKESVSLSNLDLGALYGNSFIKFVDSLESFFYEVSNLNYGEVYDFFKEIKASQDEKLLGDSIEFHKRLYFNLISNYNSFFDLINKNIINDETLKKFKFDLKLLRSLLEALVNSSDLVQFKNNYQIFVVGKGPFCGLIRFYELYVSNRNLKSQIQVLKVHIDMLT